DWAECDHFERGHHWGGRLDRGGFLGHSWRAPGRPPHGEPRAECLPRRGDSDRSLPWGLFFGRVPRNVKLESDAYLETTYSFQLFRSRLSEAVRIGRGASIYLGVMFDLGPEARVDIGDFTLMNGSRIICNAEIYIGKYCLVSWNTVL